MQHLAKRRALLDRREERRPPLVALGFAEKLPARLADEPIEVGIGLPARPVDREAIVLVLFPIEIGRQIDHALQSVVGKPRALRSLRQALRRGRARTGFARTHLRPAPNTPSEDARTCEA